MFATYEMSTTENTDILCLLCFARESSDPGILIQWELLLLSKHSPHEPLMPLLILLYLHYL
jgi:hypothetical protein